MTLDVVKGQWRLQALLEHRESAPGDDSCCLLHRLRMLRLGTPGAEQLQEVT